MTPLVLTVLARLRWPRSLFIGPKARVGRGLVIRPDGGGDAGLTVSIGARSTVSDRLTVAGFGEFAIGYSTVVGRDCTCTVAGQLVIADGVTIGDNVTFHADRTRRTFVGDDVVIGNDVTIGGGVVIEDGAVVPDSAVLVQ